MNIAFALVSREAGGAEFQTLLLADALGKRGHKAFLYCTDPAVSGRMIEQCARIPTRITGGIPRLGGRLRYLWMGMQFGRWLHRDHIDAAVGVLPMPHALLTLACLGTRIRLIGRRSCVWPELRGYGTYDAQLPRLIQWRARWGHRTQRIVANSVAAAQSAVMVEGWPGGLVRIVPNGWPEVPAVDGSCAVPYYVCRPRAEKGIDLACREFAKAGVPLALSFEPPDWGQVGILVHASRADSCSNAIGMAMAHGIPVVAFDLPGSRRLCGQDGLIPQWDYPRMAKHVWALRSWPAQRRSAGQKGRNRVRSEFSLKAMVDGWEEVMSGGG